MPRPRSDRFGFRELPRALWYFLAEDRRRYLVFLTLLVPVFVYELVPPLLLGQIADLLVHWSPGTDLTPLALLIGTLVVAGAAVALVRLESKRQLGRIAVNMRYRAKTWGFRRLVEFSLTWHQGENTGNKAQRILTGSEALREWAGDFPGQLLPTFATCAGTLVACAFLSPWFAVFFLWYLGVLGAIEAWFDHRIARISDTINQSMENASGTFVEGASNILAVKALGAGSSLAEKVEEREDAARDLSHRRIFLGNRKWMAFQIHNALSWGGFLSLIAWSVISGHLSAGFVLTYTMLFEQMRSRATEFTDRFQTMIERLSNLGRMMPFFWQDHRLAGGTEAFPQTWDALVFDRVRFRYRDEPALADLTLRVPRGSKLGIAGASGSGKSTLIKLLLGLYRPEAGRVLVGDRPLETIGHDFLTASVAVVLQESELFNLSLRDNLTMLREVDQDLLDRAVAIAQLDDLIGRLPEGLDTVIGEKGYALSGGERQRIGIARAVCRDAPVLLLDEATSALDAATEEKVMAGLFGPWSAGRTILVVAHRLPTLAGTDLVVVFENGAVVEEGTYAALTFDPGCRLYRFHAILNP